MLLVSTKARHTLLRKAHAYHTGGGQLFKEDGGQAGSHVPGGKDNCIEDTKKRGSKKGLGPSRWGEEGLEDQSVA